MTNERTARDLAIDLEDLQYRIECGAEIVSAIHTCMEDGPNTADCYLDALFCASCYLYALSQELKTILHQAIEHNDPPGGATNE